MCRCLILFEETPSARILKFGNITKQDLLFNTDINICVWEYITNLQISVKSPALTQSHIMINIFDIV